MTGPEHYREAERFLDMTHGGQAENGPGDVATPELLAEAQVHATLALAAATAEAFTPIDHAPQMWREVIR